MSNGAWKREDILDSMSEMWEKVDSVIYDGIKKRLLKERIISPKEDITFFEDMDFPDDWKIITTILRLYSKDGILDKRETIEELKGKIFILKKKRKMEPSFRFTINRRKKFLSFDIKLVKRLLEEMKALEENSAETVFGEEMAQKLIVFDLEQEKKMDKIFAQTKEMMNQLGFSEDEAMLTLHQAVKHRDFKEGMAPEKVVGIAIGLRRDGMLDSD